jgi:cell wall-associated NlpC family hydrolase
MILKPLTFFAAVYISAWGVSLVQEDQTVFNPDPPALSTTTLADSLIVFAMEYLGSPYRYGGKDPKTGFDCSGFTYFVMEKFGVKVPRASYLYQRFGKEITKDNYQKGDVILFKGSNIQEERIGHVGIIISNPGEPLQFIHASSSKTTPGVKITVFDKSPGYQQRFVGIRRVM